MTTFEEFKSLLGKGNVIPVYETVMADIETPVSVYLKIKDLSPYSFLLESVEGGEAISRYSFLGFDPFMRFTIEENHYRIDAFHDDVEVLPALAKKEDDPLTALKSLMAHIRTAPVDGLPRFIGGAVGYFGYDTVTLVEQLPQPGTDELRVPDAILLFYDTVLIFDNVLHQLFLVSLAYIPSELPAKQIRQEYQKAVDGILRLKEALETREAGGISRDGKGGSIQYGLSREEYCSRVEKAKSYIESGDIFQVVLSQRIQEQSNADPFDVYRMLRMVNPSPYMYYLSFGDFEIIGASPEMLVRVERGAIETRPIAGTRRRGASNEEDQLLEQELRTDSKEAAEHLMLVDLGRNDLGKVSRYGSVEVTELMAVERYSHVMHLVSSVRGELDKGVTALEALMACFPAGTLTGAPKIRAMEIIAELEHVKRGVYGGVIAYLDFSGNLDSCIAIRTIVSRNGVFYHQAGAGIVFDSKPEREYEETLEKLGATLAATGRLRS